MAEEIDMDSPWITELGKARSDEYTRANSGICTGDREF